MDSWLMKALTKLKAKRYALFKNLIVCLLVLSLTACGDKAIGKDVSIQLAEKPVREKNAQLSRKISEVAPPEVIQELRQSLDVYQPQVKILNPQPDEVLESNKLKVSLQVKDLPIFKDARYELGSHLEVILDNQPQLEIYDLNQPLELSDLSPGTHTLRVFASRAWHESFKNEGAYAQTTFHVFTRSDDNNPDENLPILTYNSPEGSYGAEPILLDFYLTNAPLHILAKDNPDNPIADWRIRCTINGENFIIDRWQSLYLKGFNLGQNWVKLEFLDNQGNPVKNVYNSTVKAINYEPKGKDTLAKIVRGEVSAEDLRGIVDSNYAVEITTEVAPENKVEEAEGGFFDRFKRGEEDKTPTSQPTVKRIPKVIETPEAETKLEETIPEVIETPEAETKLEETIPEVIETPEAETKLEETIPEVIEIPQPETKLEETIPEVTPIPIAPQAEESKPDGFFNRFKRDREEDKTLIPQPETNVETIPQEIETPTSKVIPESKIDRIDAEVEPEIKVTPELPTTTLPEIVEPLENEPPVIQQDIPKPKIEITPEAKQPTTERLKEYFNLPRRAIPVPIPESPQVDEVEIKAIPEQKQENSVPEISEF